MIKKKANSESEFLMNIPYKRLKKKILIGTVSKKKKKISIVMICIFIIKTNKIHF